MAHFLVTGGCGFIGSHLVDNLLNAGHKVRVLDNLSSGDKRNLNDQAQLIIGDIRNEKLVKQALSDIDGIFHLAAVSSVKKAEEEWAETHTTNLLGTITLFDAIREKAQRNKAKPIPMVYASSAAVYGDNPEIPLHEGSRTMPINAYGADKLGCEYHAQTAFRVHGIPSVGLRLFNVYGPRQNPHSPYSGVISIFINKCKEGKPITIFGEGEQIRDFVYVDDVVQAFTTAMMRMGDRCDVMNVCNGRATSINHLADTLEVIMDKPAKRHYAPARSGDIMVSIGNNDRLFKQFMFRPQVRLMTGLEATIASMGVDKGLRSKVGVPSKTHTPLPSLMGNLGSTIH